MITGASTSTTASVISGMSDTNEKGNKSSSDVYGPELDEADREMIDDARAAPPFSKIATQFKQQEKPVRDAEVEEGFAGGVRPTKSFSRREQSVALGENAHPFGGDLQRADTELALTRFQSQAGRDQIIVHWESDDDMENPQNWSKAYKWYLTVLSGILVLNSTFTSSAPSGILRKVEADLQMSEEVGILMIAIFVSGYCLGPLVWGPVSERMGRLPCFLVALSAFTCFNVGCALSRNTASILVFRFLAGSFAASPLTTSGGVIADVWDANTRGLALALFSLAPFAGPALGPIVSGAIAVTGTDWRWLFWVCTMFSAVCFVVTLLTVRETYAPIILVRKARRIRKETGSAKYVAPLELVPLKPKELLRATLLKPFIMLASEPMLLAITVYISFAYGLVYLLFEAFPFVFVGVYGFNELQSGLVFLGFFVGGIVSTLGYAGIENPRYVRMSKEAKDGRVPPEQRLIIVMIAAPILAIAFFFFGWTSFPSISFWAPLVAGGMMGCAIQLLFLGLINYMVDAYLANAASALAANTVCRSAFGAGFPLFATQMYQKLNQHWGSTLLGCLAVLLAPVPFVLFAYGPKLRAMSKHAASH